jgi:nitroreductase
MARRHSARVAFDPERALPAGHLRQVLEAARWAPTDHNMQNYEIVVIDDPERIERIGAIRAEPSPEFISENFEQLSFSEDELRRKKTGILASDFPPLVAHARAQSLRDGPGHLHAGAERHER